MVQYTVTYFGSREAAVPAAGLPVISPTGPRLFIERTAKGQARVSWALIGSSAVHVCVAVVFVSIIQPARSPHQPAEETIPLVFAPPQATEPADAPLTQDIAPEPHLPPPDPELSQPQTPPVAALNIPDPEPPPPLQLSKPIHRPIPPKTVVRPRPSNTGPVAPAPAQALIAPSPSANAPPVNAPPQAAISPGWQSAVGAWLQSNKTYPDAARRRGDEGRATVRFTVNREGRVVDFQLMASTGSVALDAAVDQLLRGARLPPFPSGMSQEQVTVTLQIRYALEH